MTSEDERTFVDAAHRYALDSRIATGGMGEVWRASDTVLGREVAVKLLKAEYADSAASRSRFETEARHAASLHHPGVAAVYDFGESAATGGSGVARPYLVMELVDGQPLSALLQPGQPLDPDAARDLLAQAADALGAAHAAGIVHRDVKPANLLVTPGRVVKITDFGIARAAEGLALTETGQVMGTPQYLSPEQARGDAATPASDVYSLGVVAFECLAGRRPFVAESPVATALAHLREPVPELPDDVPADLAGVVRRAMAKSPEERFADATELAAALRNPAAAAPATAVLTGVAPVPTPATEPTPTPAAAPTTQQRRKLPWPWILLGVVVVAAIVALALLADGGEEQPDPAARPSTSQEPSEEPTEEPTQSAPAPPPTTEASPTPTEDNTVQVDESDYVGRDVDEVEAELSDLGLQVRRDEQENPGDEEEDAVESVDPSGTLQEGETVTVSYWGPPPTEEQPGPPTVPPGQENNQ
ncbi:MAG TPA: serine/threonine protein kinase [Nocardioides sp.]|nr:serine/threonine protein kinase [Nocardioides sp.]